MVDIIHCLKGIHRGFPNRQFSSNVTVSSGSQFTEKMVNLQKRSYNLRDSKQEFKDIITNKVVI